jgi:hypothetical protein
VGRATLRQISASGAHILCDLPLLQHWTIRIQLESRKNPSERKRVTLDAEIIRSTDGGFAVEWTEFAPEAIRLLIRRLTLTSAGPQRETSPEQEASLTSTAQL